MPRLQELTGAGETPNEAAGYTSHDSLPPFAKATQRLLLGENDQQLVDPPRGREERTASSAGNSSEASSPTRSRRAGWVPKIVLGAADALLEGRCRILTFEIRDTPGVKKKKKCALIQQSNVFLIFLLKAIQPGGL